MPHSSKIISLRRYRACRAYARYTSLPDALRTRKRAEQVLEAIFEYAYEGVPPSVRLDPSRATPEMTLQVCRRLDEFIPNEGDRNSPQVMEWLHKNMLSEAWLSPDNLKGFVVECLRDA